MESGVLIFGAAMALGLCGCSLGLPLSAAVAPDVGIGVGPREGVHGQGGVSLDVLPRGHRSAIAGVDAGARFTSKGDRLDPRYGLHVGLAQMPLPYESAVGFIGLLRVYGQTDAYENTGGQGLGLSARIAVPLRLTSSLDPWAIERDRDGKLRTDTGRYDLLLAPYVDFAGTAINPRDRGRLVVEEPVSIGVALYIHWWTVVAP